MNVESIYVRVFSLVSFAFVYGFVCGRWLMCTECFLGGVFFSGLGDCRSGEAVTNVFRR